MDALKCTKASCWLCVRGAKNRVRGSRIGARGQLIQAARLAACQSVYPDCRGLDQRRAGGGRGMSAAARACPRSEARAAGEARVGRRCFICVSPSERREKLDQLAQDVQQVDTVKQLTITGYTDRLGSAAYNLRLSERRAQA